ncbi:biogenesis of lysosome-related organelles complex 1 subunit 4-like [Scleropages formosus]|uniref:Biogenesis of lysosome-related organelles complex 1 subunit 4-like n=1 Tax=Scleropages formosus TaxID=113540 RepID=A0A0P7ZEH9_SCLFO|nr:biogenesis of lysosome-related organelles complex 1 subunit 4-like [Scleropages formosus]
MDGQADAVEESALDTSGDSGNVSQSTSSLSVTSGVLSSGTVSQSHSFFVGPEEERVLQLTAQNFASYLTASADDEGFACYTAKMYNFEKSLEEMLTRVDEFVGMLDMIRNDTSQIVSENLPQIQRKSEEMRQIYRKIDKLEAFVKMVSSNVSAMEEQVTQVEGEQGTLPGAFKKILRTMAVPGFLNKPASPRRPQHQEPPSVFRTEDYFMSGMEQWQSREQTSSP